MSPHNVEVVRKSAEALNAGDVDTALSYLARDAEWQVAAEHPESRVCRGHEEIREYLTEWASQLRDLSFELADLADRGERVVASGRVRGVGVGSDVEVVIPIAFVYTFEADKIVRGEEYLDPAEALEAAGLRE
jgi:ketosteroid isomerase-like protein